MNQSTKKGSQKVREVNLGDKFDKIKSVHVFFPAGVTKKTYKVTTDDVCEIARTKFIEDFECVVVRPPF